MEAEQEASFRSKAVGSGFKQAAGEGSSDGGADSLSASEATLMPDVSSLRNDHFEPVGLKVSLSEAIVDGREDGWDDGRCFGVVVRGMNGKRGPSKSSLTSGEEKSDSSSCLKEAIALADRRAGTVDALGRRA